jgi:hypothetical protein
MYGVTNSIAFQAFLTQKLQQSNITILFGFLPPSNQKQDEYKKNTKNTPLTV